ncbi:MAG: hypothetical protein RLZZ08_154 [Pseudomonadota bacterium]|jgi:hypothetical protein
MLFSVMSFLSAVALAYFISRAVLRVPLFSGNAIGLIQAHAVAAAALIGLTIVLKYPVGAFLKGTVPEVIVIQAALFGLDIARGIKPRGTASAR